MTNPECPSVEELSRRISLGEPGPLAEHVASCPECGAEWEGRERLRALVRELPAPLPEASAVSAVRERVLEGARATERSRRRRRVFGSAIAVAATIALSVSAPWKAKTGAGQAPAYHAVLTGAPSAAFVRESGLPNEFVRLDEGTLHVEVEKLRPGERFVVRAGDGEVEVRGTAFDVSVLDGHLSSVHVERGRVEVRAPSAPPVVLSIGEEWKAATARGAPIAPLLEPSSAPPPEPAPPRSVVVTPPSEPSRAREPGGRGPAVTDVEPPKVPEPTSAVVTKPVGPVGSAAPAPAPVTPAPAVPPVAPTVPASPSQGDDARGRDDARRERRDERRERYDQRRLR
jgi:hypothetical protein